MNFFDKNNHDWRKRMQNLIQNVALNEIVRSDDSSISFKFLSTYNGKSYKKILCHNVWKLCFDSDVEDEDRVSRFISDIMILKLENELVEEAFKYFKYGFQKIPDSKEYYLLSILGSEIDIDILCGDIELSEIQ